MHVIIHEVTSNDWIEVYSLSVNVKLLVCLTAEKPVVKTKIHHLYISVLKIFFTDPTIGVLEIGYGSCELWKTVLFSCTVLAKVSSFSQRKEAGSSDRLELLSVAAGLLYSTTTFPKLRGLWCSKMAVLDTSGGFSIR